MQPVESAIRERKENIVHNFDNGLSENNDYEGTVWDSGLNCQGKDTDVSFKSDVPYNRALCWEGL